MTSEQMEELRIKYHREHDRTTAFQRSIGLLCLMQDDGNIRIGETNRREYETLAKIEADSWDEYNKARTE